MTAPVIFMVFNRPAETRRAFAAIRRGRPEKLLIVADGPRPDRPDDIALCAETRAIFDTIDWPCEVLKDFAAENMGCGRRVASGLAWAFGIVPEAIILEDDCIADPSFFPFCTGLLERYREDARIGMISGNNFQAGLRRTADSYYFSRLPHCWGWATWARVFRLYDFSMAWWPQVRQSRWLKSIARYPMLEALWERAFEQVATGKLDTWDYQWFYTIFGNGLLSAAPAGNLVENIGFGTTATHTRARDDRHIQPVAPATFPTRHPSMVEVCEEADDFERRYLHGLSRAATHSEPAAKAPGSDPQFNPITHYHQALKLVGVHNYENSTVSGEDTFLRRYLPGITNALVLDVGANRGDYTEAVLEICPSAKVIALEPHPTTFSHLSTRFRDSRVVTLNIGLGAADTTTEIYDYRDEDASAHASLHRAVIEEIHGRPSTSHRVEIRQLDKLAHEFGITRIHLMKVDTEGHELPVLKGAEGLIRRGAVDAIQFEFNEMNVVSRTFFKDFWDFLPEYNFYRLLPGGFLHLNAYTPMFCEIFAFQNIVCLKKKV